jgi:(1->4)-alpha-D-glucan 1-alpha-D-glucosylmutase
LLSVSSHDTKRSEDVRARLAVLAEMPEEWGLVVESWRKHHQRHRPAVPPDANTEWLIYQTVVGAWPIDAERLVAYVAKATHEAKEHTSWTDPDDVYDQAVARFIREALADPVFTADVELFVGGIRRWGWVNSLAQKLLTLTAPGVADLYQGSEVWDLSLVDPDNRRAVDYDLRHQLFAQANAWSAADAWGAEDGSGLAKLILVWTALTVRRSHPEWFAPGSYEALPVTGATADHAIAFCRGGGAVTVAPRLPRRLAATGGWLDGAVELPPGRWVDQFEGSVYAGVVPLSQLLADFPVGLLVVE